jgi:hypothetical protein
MSDYYTIKDSVETAQDNRNFTQEIGAAEAMLNNFIYTHVRIVDVVRNGELDGESEDYQQGALSVISHFENAVAGAIQGLDLLDLTDEEVDRATAKDLVDAGRNPEDFGYERPEPSPLQALLDALAVAQGAADEQEED